MSVSTLSLTTLMRMHELDLIPTLTGGLAAALICGTITHRLGLSPIVGYLIGGFLVGPNTPGFVADQRLADQLAEIGVILLMFGVGLQFHLQELLAVRRTAILGALGQSLVATLLGMIVGLACGWTPTASVILGLAISVASTVVMLRVLENNQALDRPEGHLAVGWLVVEDLLTVITLVLLPNLVRQGSAWDLSLAVAMAVLKVGLMVAVTLVAGKRLIPLMLKRAADTDSRELFTLTVLVMALGIAVGAAKIFGVSMALGAFLAGMVVGRSDYSARAATDAMPMRDAFAVLFFVSIGMLFSPRDLLESPGPVLGALAVILIGKPIAALAILGLMRHPLRVSLAVACALAQIGEFSFILGAAGRALGVLDQRATNTLVAASIVSMTLNPVLYRLVDPLDRLIRGTRRPSIEISTPTGEPTILSEEPIP